MQANLTIAQLLDTQYLVPATPTKYIRKDREVINCRYLNHFILCTKLDCSKILFIFNSNKFETNRIEFPVHFGAIIIGTFFTSPLSRIKGKMCDLSTFFYDNIFLFEMTPGHGDTIPVQLYSEQRRETVTLLENFSKMVRWYIIGNDGDGNMNFKKVPQISWF